MIAWQKAGEPGFPWQWHGKEAFTGAYGLRDRHIGGVTKRGRLALPQRAVLAGASRPLRGAQFEGGARLLAAEPRGACGQGGGPEAGGLNRDAAGRSSPDRTASPRAEP
jgi:hypothetical protein